MVLEFIFSFNLIFFFFDLREIMDVTVSLELVTCTSTRMVFVSFHFDEIQKFLFIVYPRYHCHISDSNMIRIVSSSNL